MVNCSDYPEDTVQILESPRLSSRVDRAYCSLRNEMERNETKRNEMERNEMKICSLRNENL